MAAESKTTTVVISLEDFNSLLSIRGGYNIMIEGLRCITGANMDKTKNRVLRDAPPTQAKQFLRLVALYDNILSGKLRESWGGIVFKNNETASTITELEEKVKELAKLRSLLSVDNLTVLEEKAKELEKLKSLLSANKKIIHSSLVDELYLDLHNHPVHPPEQPLTRAEKKSIARLLNYLADL